MNHTVRFGVSTFGDVPNRPGEERLTHAETIREVVEQGVLAEAFGIDDFLIGEHHRDDMPLSAPDMALAAIAGQTSTIGLGTAVSVLSTDDPVRVYERFATLDAISGGRAEPILGRGSFTETFPLFGYDLADYDALFAEKLDLWAQLRREVPVTWSGDHRPALSRQLVYPRTDRRGGLPTWGGVGGSPESVVRVAQHGFGLMLAGLGQTLPRLEQYVDLFHRASAQFERPIAGVGLSVGGFVAESDQEARDLLWPQYDARMTRIGRDRGWAPQEREAFVWSIDHGMQFVGSVDTVVDKIATTVETLGLDRINVGYDTVDMPLATKTRSLELLGREVFPRVRERLGLERFGASTSEAAATEASAA